MAKHFTAILLFAAVTVVGGCTSEYRLNEKMLEHIQSTDVLVVVDQHEINAQIAGSNVVMFTGGGLLPALIDAAVENAQAQEAEKLLAPIRDSLTDYNYPATLKTSIESGVGKIDWLHAQQFALEQNVTKERFLEIYQQSNSCILLTVKVSYEFLPDFTGISVKGGVSLWPRSDELREHSGAAKRKDPVSMNNRIHYAALEVKKKLDLEGVKGKAAIDVLAEDNAARVRKALNEAADELTALIAENLNKAAAGRST